MAQTAGTERRIQLKDRYWKREQSWDGTFSGWFKAPRTLPLIFALLSGKELTAGRDVSGVYLELLARNMDTGIVEIGSEADHAFASGYTGTRAIRTWQERIRILETLGFIKTKQVGNQKFKLVLLVDPFVVITNLRKQQRVPDDWWEAYSLRLIETKEADAERREIMDSLDSSSKKKRAKEAA